MVKKIIAVILVISIIVMQCDVAVAETTAVSEVSEAIVSRLLYDMGWKVAGGTDSDIVAEAQAIMQDARDKMLNVSGRTVTFGQLTEDAARWSIQFGKLLLPLQIAIFLYDTYRLGKDIVGYLMTDTNVRVTSARSGKSSDLTPVICEFPELTSSDVLLVNVRLPNRNIKKVNSYDYLLYGHQMSWGVTIINDKYYVSTPPIYDDLYGFELPISDPTFAFEVNFTNGRSRVWDNNGSLLYDGYVDTSGLTNLLAQKKLTFWYDPETVDFNPMEYSGTYQIYPASVANAKSNVVANVMIRQSDTVQNQNIAYDVPVSDNYTIDVSQLISASVTGYPDGIPDDLAYVEPPPEEPPPEEPPPEEPPIRFPDIPITTKFPFSLPWDVAYILGMLAAEPRAPRVQAHLPAPYNADIDIDTARILPETLMERVRQVELLLFAVGLIYGTRRLLGGAE